MRTRVMAALGAAVIPIGAAIVGVVPIAAAAAADPTPATIVRNTSPLTTAATLNGLTFYNNNASADPDPATGNVAIVNGPGTPPLGQGSLRLGTGSNGNTGVALFDQSYLNYYFNSDFSVVIPFPITYQPAALFLSFGYHETTTDLPLVVTITLWHGAGPVSFTEALPTGADWQTFDITTAPLLQVDGDGVTTHTLKDWAQPGDSLFAVFVGVDFDSTLSDPNPNKFAYLDNLTYGFGVTQGGTSIHPVTTFNFETNSTAPSQTVTSSKSAIDAGQSVALGDTVKNGATAVSGAHVDLWAKPSGASAYHKVGSATTDATGHATSNQKPTVGTSYRWRYMGTNDNPEIPGVDSAVKAVGVRTTVTAKAADTTLTTSQGLKISGATTPAKGGATLTVYRIVGGNARRFGTVKADAKGRYTYLHGPLAKGDYSFAIGVPALSGNLAGRSASVAVKVA
jgi:hypothetical protein